MTIELPLAIAIQDLVAIEGPLVTSCRLLEEALLLLDGHDGAVLAAAKLSEVLALTSTMLTPEEPVGFTKDGSSEKAFCR